MPVFTREITVSTDGPHTYEITTQVATAVSESGLREGSATVFCRHTSCSLVIMENANPSARRDLEDYLDRLVPERDPRYTHTSEGPDDMPSHIKMALTRTSEVIPIAESRLQFGTWQGIFLWEHRKHRHDRRVIITVAGV